jgi:hypothetical protein
VRHSGAPAGYTTAIKIEKWAENIGARVFAYDEKKGTLTEIVIKWLTKKLFS